MGRCEFQQSRSFSRQEVVVLVVGLESLQVVSF
jgi:hypothetical protein